MNVLLLDEAETRETTVLVGGRRASHVARVLRKQPGDDLRIGVVGRGVGTARVVSANTAELVLDSLHLKARPAPRTRLILAVPRPKGLSRIVQAASSFGLSQLHLIGAWKVDPAYFDSPRLLPARLEADARLGLEQGGGCHLPTISVHRGFRRFVEAELPGTEGSLNSRRVVFDPSAAQSLPHALGPDIAPDCPVYLALGPDGGFIEPELGSFRRAGFALATLAPAVLRTEVAVPAALGQLQLVLDLAQESP